MRIIDGFEVSMRSRILLPQSIRVGSFTMFCKPFVVHYLWQFFMFAGRSVVSDLIFAPVGIREAEVSRYDNICVLYSFVRDSWKAAYDWRWSLGGR